MAQVNPVRSLPRVDQLVDFTRIRVLRLLGSGTRTGRAGRAALTRSGRRSGRLLATCAQILHRLDAGQQVPWDELRPVLDAVLERADAARARSRTGRSDAWADLAVRLAYHRSTHSGPAHSPLMLRAEEFLAPFRASASGRALLLDPDNAPVHGPEQKAARAHGERPLRVLILCHSSWTFVRRVEADLEEHANVEFRSVDVSTLPLPDRPTHGLVLQQRSAWNRDGTLHPVPTVLEEPLAWADTVFVEWGTQPFAWFSLLDLSPFEARIVARIHRFEGLTPYPMLARGAAYDAICFVSTPLRTFFESVSPRITQSGRRFTFHNMHSLEGFTPSPDPHRFELLQIGWAVPVKDVAFSLEVVRRLREIDDRYVLRLVGPTLEETRTTGTAAWAEKIAHQVEELGEGVVVEGFRSDIPDLLAETGFILSASVVEGTHESVAEGAVAGCIPVVRDWPEIVPWGGAGKVYPAEWIVADVDAAVRRILSFTDAAAFDAAAAAARAWVLESRRTESIRADYLAFLSGS